MDHIQPWLNITDISVLVILVLGILGGARRGLAGELMKVITAVLAIVVAWRMNAQAADWLSKPLKWPDDDLRVLAFFGIIIAVYVILTLIRMGFRLFIDFSFKGKIELLGGALFGLLRATALCIVVLLLVALIKHEGLESLLSKSRAANFVHDNIRPIYDDWASKNPDFKLPDREKIKERGITPPDWEQFLGPLIAPDDE
ncbi:MAG TPA: CvpA family protein [Kiritimatiellia bacterium]|nr:CvpA family protein [Kiritimatiellia bacterium]